MKKETLERGNEILSTIKELRELLCITNYPFIRFSCAERSCDIASCDLMTIDKIESAIQECVNNRIKELEEEFEKL